MKMLQETEKGEKEREREGKEGKKARKNVRKEICKAKGINLNLLSEVIIRLK